MNLVTPDEVKRYLNINTQNGKDETLIAQFIAAASSRIERHCRNPITRQPITFVRGGSGSGDMLLKYRPVHQVTEILSGPSLDSLAALPTTAYRLVMRGPCYAIQLTAGVFNPSMTYRITLEAGLDEVPAEVKQVAIEMVAIQWDRSDIGGKSIGKQSVAKGANGAVTSSTTYNDEPLKSEWLELLKPYRILMF
jgi:hypothetical protein